jgi:hypothetical protein
MKVCEGPSDLQDLIFEFFEVDRNNPDEEERVELILNNLLHNIRYELLHGYHYESDEDKKKIQNIVKKIDACGT